MKEEKRPKRYQENVLNNLFLNSLIANLYRVSGGFVATGKIDFRNSGWRYMQFGSLYGNVTMFGYFTT